MQKNCHTLTLIAYRIVSGAEWCHLVTRMHISVVLTGNACKFQLAPKSILFYRNYSNDKK